MKCSATSKSGTPCRWEAGESGLCLVHDPARRDELAERSLRGGKKSGAARQRTVRASCSLRTVSDLLAELERALLLVEKAAGDSVQRATAISRIVSEAHSILRGDLEKQADRLAKLLEENPTLRRHLESVK